MCRALSVEAARARCQGRVLRGTNKLGIENANRDDGTADDPQVSAVLVDVALTATVLPGDGARLKRPFSG